MKKYALVEDKAGNMYVVPMSSPHTDIGDFRDMLEQKIGVETRGTVFYMSLTELRKRAKAGEMV